MVNALLSPLSKHIKQSNSPIQKLILIADFYRNYYSFSKQLGGCPILNIGVDSNNSNSELLQKVREVIQKIQDQLCSIIENGIEEGEISTKINAMQYAKRIDTIIQGAIFMTYTMNDEFYMKNTMDLIDQIIHKELKI